MSLLKVSKDLIKWDKTGRITFFENDFEKATNIVDLLNYATRDLTWW